MDRLAFIGKKAMGALEFEPSTGEELTPHEVHLLTIASEVRQVMEDGSDFRAFANNYPIERETLDAMEKAVLANLSRVV